MDVIGVVMLKVEVGLGVLVIEIAVLELILEEEEEEGLMLEEEESSVALEESVGVMKPLGGSSFNTVIGATQASVKLESKAQPTMGRDTTNPSAK